MEIANVEMAEQWDGEEGDDWTENADRYDATDRYIVEAFDAEITISTTDQVLDIGCGTGKWTRRAARAAPSGRVLGVDLSSRMLEYARRRSAEEGLTNVDYLQADAQVHPFAPSAFDLGASFFGAMFFNDPVAALTNVRRALRPGGTLALVTWREFEHNDWLGTIFQALDAGRQLPTPRAGDPGPFGLADEDAVRGILGDAGYADVDITPLDAPVWLAADADEAWAFVSTMGLVRGLTDGLEAHTAAQGLARLRKTIAAHETPDGVLLGAAEWVITASA